MTPIILIPSRLRSSRLPRKPLAIINGEAMIVHVWRRAIEANLGPVLVACEDQEIADVILSAGGNALLTGNHHNSGTDRIFEALQIIDSDQNHEIIINLQGDLPAIDPKVLHEIIKPFENEDVDICTIASPLKEKDVHDKNIVKVRVNSVPKESMFFAQSFFRSGEENVDSSCYHHIGIYAYRRHIIEKFVSLPPCSAELSLGLEQLRAIEAGMKIYVGFVDTFPLGVDTPSDLVRVRAEMSSGLL